MALSERQLFDALSRMPFIDSVELALILGEPHATVHRALAGLLAGGIVGSIMLRHPPGQTSPNGGFVGRGAPAVRPGGPQFRRFISGGPSRATDNPVLADGCTPGLAAIVATAKADPWEEGGALSGALNPRYAKIRDGMQEKQQQSKVARRRGGRRRDDLKDSAYKMPQIVVEQEPASLSPNPPKDDFGDSP